MTAKTNLQISQVSKSKMSKRIFLSEDVFNDEWNGIEKELDTFIEDHNDIIEEFDSINNFDDISE